MLNRIVVALSVPLLSVLILLAVKAWAQDGAQPGSLSEIAVSDDVQMLELGPSLFHPEYADMVAGFVPRRLVYIVQDPEGVVRGRLKVSMSVTDVKGELCRELVKEYEYPFVGRSRLVADGLSLAPAECWLTLYDLQSGPIPDGARPAETWSAEYYYDLVAVAVESKDVGTFYSFRHPMQAYDLEELYLLFGQLTVERFPRLSVLFVTAPFRYRNYAVLIRRMGRESIYAADAEKHICEHLLLEFSDSTQEFFVETMPPHRVVKFTSGQFTYTLIEDDTAYEDDSRGTLELR
jgi:hypothetical protein